MELFKKISEKVFFKKVFTCEGHTRRKVSKGLILNLSDSPEVLKVHKLSPKVFYNKAVLKNNAKHLCWNLLLIQLQVFKPANLLKKTPTQVFSCEYCKIFKNPSFEEHLRTAASESSCTKSQMPRNFHFDKLYGMTQNIQ